MTTAFLLVLGLLIGVLAFRDRSVASKNLTTEKVADAVLPSTVLIYSASAMQYGYGTGFFVRQDGYIATNYHVVEGANSITVTFYPSGQSLPAEVVGYSAADDLAVIRVEGNGYPVAKIGDSDAIRVGDVAIAIGNPAGTSAPWTTTQGIISSTGRTVTVNGSSSIGEMNMIQTDAPVNPGNSGGFPYVYVNSTTMSLIFVKSMSLFDGFSVSIFRIHCVAAMGRPFSPAALNSAAGRPPVAPLIFAGMVMP